MNQKEENFPLLPPEEFISWMEENPRLVPGAISGRSLKYIRSRIPTIAVRLEPGAFQGYRRDQENGLLEEAVLADIGLVKFFAREGEIKLIISPKNSDGEYHCLIQEEKEDPAAVLISLDRLQYDPAARRWTGEETALADLKQERLRLLAPENPDTIAALQVCALSSMLDFDPGEEELDRLARNFSPTEADSLSPVLLKKILKRLATGARPSRGFINLDKIDALEWFLPELARGRGLSQNRYHKYDIFYHSVYACDAVREPNLVLRLAALFHDLGKVDTRKLKPNGEASFHNHEMVSNKHAARILNRFRIESWIARRVKFLVRNHMFHYTQEWSDRAVRRFMNKIKPEILEDLIKLRLADREGSSKQNKLPRAIYDLMRHMEEVRARENEFKVRDLELTGHDLMNLGMQPGPGMGRCLRHLMERVKEETLPNEEEALREEARRWLQENGAEERFSQGEKIKVGGEASSGTS